MKHDQTVYVDRKYNYAMCSCAEIIYTKKLNYKGIFLKTAKGEIRAISQDDADKIISDINPKQDLFTRNEVLNKFTTQKPQSTMSLFNTEKFFESMEHTINVYDIMVNYFKKVIEELNDKDGFYYDTENYDDRIDGYLDAETNSMQNDIEIESILDLIKKYKLRLEQDIPMFIITIIFIMAINQDEQFYNVIKKAKFKKTCVSITNNPQMFDTKRSNSSDLMKSEELKKDDTGKSFYKQVTLENTINTNNSVYKAQKGKEHGLQNIMMKIKRYLSELNNKKFDIDHLETYFRAKGVKLEIFDARDMTSELRLLYPGITNTEKDYVLNHLIDDNTRKDYSKKKLIDIYDYCVGLDNYNAQKIARKDIKNKNWDKARALLEEITKFAIEKKTPISFLEACKEYDTFNKNCIKTWQFQEAIKKIGVNLPFTGESWKQLEYKYTTDSEVIDYLQFHQDAKKVSRDYEKLFGSAIKSNANDSKNKTGLSEDPKNVDTLMREYADRITTVCPTLTEYFNKICKPGRSYLEKQDLVTSLQKEMQNFDRLKVQTICRKIWPVNNTKLWNHEFISVIKPYLYEKIEQMIKQLTKHLIGMNQSLATQISKKNGTLKKQISVVSFNEAIYDLCQISKNKILAMMGYLEVKIRYDDTFEWNEFKKKFIDFIVKMNIVASETDAEKLFKTDNSSKNDLSIIAHKMLEELKIKLGIITKEDAIKRFSDLSVGRSEYLSKDEFKAILIKHNVSSWDFDLSNDKLRPFSEEVTGKMFTLMDPNNRNKLYKGDFVKYMDSIKVKDMTELYLRKFEAQKPVFEDIAFELHSNLKKLTDADMFKKIDRVSREKFFEVLKKVNVPRNDQHSVLLTQIADQLELEVKSYQNTSKMIDINIFSKIVNYYQQNKIQDIKEKHNLQNKDFSRLDPELRESIKKKIEQIRKKLNKNHQQVASQYLGFDNDQDGKLNLDEFAMLLNGFLKNQYYDEHRIIFNLIDTNNSGTISLKEFVTFFEIKTFHENVDKINKFNYAIDIQFDINNKLQKNGLSFNRLKSPTGSVTKDKFQMFLNEIDVNIKNYQIEFPVIWRRFLSDISTPMDPNSVDINLLIALLKKNKSYIENLTINAPFISDSRRDTESNKKDQILYNILGAFDYSSSKAIRMIDINHDGYVMKQEFFTTCNKFVKYVTKDNVEFVWNKLTDNGRSRYIKDYEFKDEFEKVKLKYLREQDNRQENQNIWGDKVKASSSYVDPYSKSDSFGDYLLSSLKYDDRFAVEQPNMNHPGMQLKYPLKKENIFERIKSDKNVTKDKLIRAFKKIDSKKRKTLPLRYLIQPLKELSINLDEKDEEEISKKVRKTSDELFFYDDFIEKIFCNDEHCNHFGKMNIENTKNLVKYFKSEMTVRGMSIEDLFKEIDDDEDDYLNYDEFVDYTRHHKLIINDENMMDIYMDFDEEKDSRVSFWFFRKTIYDDKYGDTLNIIKNEIRGILYPKNLNMFKLCTEIGIKKDDSTKDKTKNRKTMKEKMEEERLRKERQSKGIADNSVLKFRINDFITSKQLIDLLTDNDLIKLDINKTQGLFTKLDDEDNRKIKVQVLIYAIDEELYDENISKAADQKQQLQVNDIRKKIFEELVDKNLTLKQLWSLSDTNMYLMISKPGFEKLLENTGFGKLDEKTVLRLMDEFDLDRDDMVSWKEFKQVYDKANVAKLFPGISIFQKRLEETLQLKKTNIRSILKEFCKPGRNDLSKPEFINMLAAFRLRDEINKNIKNDFFTDIYYVDNKEADFIFKFYDTNRKDSVDFNDIRTRLKEGKFIDVVQIFNFIRQQVKQNNVDIAMLFQLVDKDKSNEVNFSEWYLLLTQYFNIELNIISYIETFIYLDKELTGKVNYDTFVKAMNPYNSIPVQMINTQFYANLPKDDKAKYTKNYNFTADTLRNQIAMNYSKDFSDKNVTFNEESLLKQATIANSNMNLQQSLYPTNMNLPANQHMMGQSNAMPINQQFLNQSNMIENQQFLNQSNMMNQNSMMQGNQQFLNQNSLVQGNHQFLNQNSLMAGNPPVLNQNSLMDNKPFMQQPNQLNNNFGANNTQQYINQGSNIGFDNIQPAKKFDSLMGHNQPFNASQQFMPQQSILRNINRADSVFIPNGGMDNMNQQNNVNLTVSQMPMNNTPAINPQQLEKNVKDMLSRMSNGFLLDIFFLFVKRVLIACTQNNWNIQSFFVFMQTSTGMTTSQRMSAQFQQNICTTIQQNANVAEVGAMHQLMDADASGGICMDEFVIFINKIAALEYFDIDKLQIYKLGKAIKTYIKTNKGKTNALNLNLNNPNEKEIINQIFDKYSEQIYNMNHSMQPMQDNNNITQKFLSSNGMNKLVNDFLITDRFQIEFSQNLLRLLGKNNSNYLDSQTFLNVFMIVDELEEIKKNKPGGMDSQIKENRKETLRNLKELVDLIYEQINRDKTQLFFGKLSSEKKQIIDQKQNPKVPQKNAPKQIYHTERVINSDSLKKLMDKVEMQPKFRDIYFKLPDVLKRISGNRIDEINKDEYENFMKDDDKLKKSKFGGNSEEDTLREFLIDQLNKSDNLEMIFFEQYAFSYYEFNQDPPSEKNKQTTMQKILNRPGWCTLIENLSTRDLNKQNLIKGLHFMINLCKPKFKNATNYDEFQRLINIARTGIMAGNVDDMNDATFEGRVIYKISNCIESRMQDENIKGHRDYFNIYARFNDSMATSGMQQESVIDLNAYNTIMRDLARYESKFAYNNQVNEAIANVGNIMRTLTQTMNQFLTFKDFMMLFNIQHDIKRKLEANSLDSKEHVAKPLSTKNIVLYCQPTIQTLLKFKLKSEKLGWNEYDVFDKYCETYKVEAKPDLVDKKTTEIPIKEVPKAKFVILLKELKPWDDSKETLEKMYYVNHHAKMIYSHSKIKGKNGLNKDDWFNVFKLNPYIPDELEYEKNKKNSVDKLQKDINMAQRANGINIDTIYEVFNQDNGVFYKNRLESWIKTNSLLDDHTQINVISSYYSLNQSHLFLDKDRFIKEYEKINNLELKNINKEDAEINKTKLPTMNNNVLDLLNKIRSAINYQVNKQLKDMLDGMIRDELIVQVRYEYLSKFDKGGTNSLDLAEFKEMLKDLSLDAVKPIDKDNVFKYLDKENNGEVFFEEFYRLCYRETIDVYIRDIFSINHDIFIAMQNVVEKKKVKTLVEYFDRRDIFLGKYMERNLFEFNMTQFEIRNQNDTQIIKSLSTEFRSKKKIDKTTSYTNLKRLSDILMDYMQVFQRNDPEKYSNTISNKLAFDNFTNKSKIDLMEKIARSIRENAKLNRLSEVDFWLTFDKTNAQTKSLTIQELYQLLKTIKLNNLSTKEREYLENSFLTEKNGTIYIENFWKTVFGNDQAIIDKVFYNLHDAFYELNQIQTRQNMNILSIFNVSSEDYSRKYHYVDQIEFYNKVENSLKIHANKGAIDAQANTFYVKNSRKNIIDIVRINKNMEKFQQTYGRQYKLRGDFKGITQQAPLHHKQLMVMEDEAPTQNYNRMQPKAGLNLKIPGQNQSGPPGTEPLSHQIPKKINNESYTTAAFAGDQSNYQRTIHDTTFVSNLPQSKFNDMEKRLINKVIKGVARYMAVDNMPFIQVFGKYDYDNSNLINPSDMHKAVFHDLHIDLKEDIIQLLQNYYYDDKYDMIDLISLRMDIDKELPEMTRVSETHKSYYPTIIPKQEANVAHFSHNIAKPKNEHKMRSQYTPAVKEQVFKLDKDAQNNWVPRSKLANYDPPNTVMDLKTQDSIIEDINKIKDWYYIQHDLAGPKIWEQFNKDDRNYIERMEFIDCIKRSDFEELDEVRLSNVFSFLDQSNSEKIGYNVFTYYFFTRKELEEAMESNEMDENLEAEFLKLFKGLDQDNSGSLEFHEFVECLHKLGYFISPSTCEKEFRKVDTDHSGKIEYNEFRKLLINFMRKDLLTIDQWMSIITRNWKSVHPQNFEDLNSEQFKKFLHDSNILLLEEEIEGVFNDLCIRVKNKRYHEVDGVKIPEIVSISKILLSDFIKILKADDSNPLMRNPNIKHAAFKVKRAANLSISNLFSAFEKVPYNFCHSFTSRKLTELKNQPFEGLLPSISRDTFRYDGINGRYLSVKENRVQPIKPILSGFLREITVIVATGVPIPSDIEMEYRNQKIVSREIRVSLVDNSNKISNNIMIMKAKWSDSREDEWSIDSDTYKDSNLFVIKDARIGENTGHITINDKLVFELIMVVIINDQRYDMSCGWCSIKLKELIRNQDIILNLKGGNLESEQDIKSKDVHTGRKNIFGKFAKNFGSVKSELKIKIRPITPGNSANDALIQEMSQLPETIIAPRNCVTWLALYRKYLGIKSVKNHILNTRLPEEITVRAMMKCYNLHSIQIRIGTFFHKNKEVDIFVAQMADNHDAYVNWFDRFMSAFFIMFECNDFHYLPSMPTDDCQENKRIRDERLKLYNIYLTEAKDASKNLNRTTNVENIKKPFDIDQLMEDDFGYLDDVQELDYQIGDF